MPIEVIARHADGSPHFTVLTGTDVPAPWGRPASLGSRPASTFTAPAAPPRPPTEPQALPEPPPMPGLFEQAANFSLAAIRHAAAGLRRAPPEVIEARLAICRTCEFYDAERVRCRKCGCGLVGDLMGKATWPEQSCPIGKWGPVSAEDAAQDRHD